MILMPTVLIPIKDTHASAEAAGLTPLSTLSVVLDAVVKKPTCVLTSTVPPKPNAVKRQLDQCVNVSVDSSTSPDNTEDRLEESAGQW